MAEKPQEWILHIISNTHWDREWYFSFERFRYRLVRLMDRLLSLLENQPEDFPFLMDGQYIPIQDYLEVRPERRDEVEWLVRAGRLQIGPWYTQPLETIASGEAMVRNLMLGVQRSLALGGVTRIGYMVDEFGHASQLPQICRGFGIEDVVIWRGVPRGMPSTFRWLGSDGTPVQVFYSNSGYGEATALPEQVEDFIEWVDWTPHPRAGLRRRIEALRDLRAPKATTRHLLALNGIDHSFAQEDLPDVLRKADGLVPGVRLVHSSLPDYIQAVKAEHAAEDIPLQDYTGELLDSNEPVLKDIHSFRCQQKALNREVETLLEKWAEPFACLAWLAGSPYPQAELWKAWEYVLQNHSHDSLGCSSVDEVYTQVMERYAWAAGLAREIQAESLGFLARQSAPADLDETEDGLPLLVFNPLDRPRSEWVRAVIDLPQALGYETLHLSDGEREVPYTLYAAKDTFHVRYNPQRGHSTRTPVRQVEMGFYAADVPGLGYKTYRMQAASPAQVSLPPLSPAPGVLENDFLRVRIHPDGTYDLLDKAGGAVFNGLGFFEDGGEAGDGYNHAAPEQDEAVTSRGAPADVRMVRDDGLEAAYEIDLIMPLPDRLDPSRTRRGEWRAACRVTQQLVLRRESRRLDVSVTVDNHARDHRLRVVFPTHLNSESSWAAMPFEVVERPIALPDPAAYGEEKPRPTHPQHHFVDLNDGKTGLMVANRGLYEYEVTGTEQRSIILTLLRATDRLDSGSLGAVDEMKMPLGQEIGPRSFAYSLVPHAGDWEAAAVEADSFAAPLLALLARELELERLPGYDLPRLDPPLAPAEGFIDLEPDGLVITALKKHQTRPAVVVRALNRSPRPVHARLRLHFPGRVFAEVWQADLAENLLDRLPLNRAGWVEADLPPWGLWTTAWLEE